MKTIKFKTNIKCDACINTVTPFLGKVEGLENWSVDLQDPARTMTAHILEDATENEIKKALAAAGYSGQRIN